eukprot:365638-Chlamydomonas_euryale.AAC.2
MAGSSGQVALARNTSCCALTDSNAIDARTIVGSWHGKRRGRRRRLSGTMCCVNPASKHGATAWQLLQGPQISPWGSSRWTGRKRLSKGAQRVSHTRTRGAPIDVYCATSRWPARELASLHGGHLLGVSGCQAGGQDGGLGGPDRKAARHINAATHVLTCQLPPSQRASRAVHSTGRRRLPFGNPRKEPRRVRRRRHDALELRVRMRGDARR